MNKKLLSITFLLTLLLFGFVPTVQGHFFEPHVLETIKSCELADTPTANKLCDQYLEVMIACNLASDWAVVFYFLEDGKFYRFTHARQYYNNLLENAGSDEKLRACAIGAGLHHHQDPESHGFIESDGTIEQGYVGQTISKFFITNALGHGPVERNMVNNVLDLDSINFRGQKLLITTKNKEDALFFRDNGLNIFNDDPELVDFLFSGSEEIPRETIENAIAIVGTAVSGGKQESVFTDFEIPTFWWVLFIGILSVGLLMFLIFSLAFLFAKGIFTKIFIGIWLIIFLIIIVVGFFGTLGLVNGKAYIYYEFTIDFFANFLEPSNPEAFLNEGIGNSIDFLETGVHKFGDASGWEPLAQASRFSFVFLAVILIAFIASSIFILIRLRRELKGKKEILKDSIFSGTDI